MQDVADALSLILGLSEEIVIAKVFYGVVSMLRGGEILLGYSLLLAAGLASESDTRQMWDLLEHLVAGKSPLSEDPRVMVIIALTVVTYASGEGTEALFPSLYRELVKRNLQPVAKQAWEWFGGDPGVWSALERKVRTHWDSQSDSWQKHQERWDSDAWEVEVEEFYRLQYLHG